jgi:hypothetical protein
MTRTDPLDVPRPHAQLHFGVFFQGVNHWTVWSAPDSGSQIDPASFRRVAQTAERGLFDAFFLGEGLRLREVDGRIHDLDVAGRPDAVTQLAALAAVTRRIGLVSTSNSTFNEPADLARRLSGLDLLSEGRAGWNVVTTDNAWTGANFRRGGYLDHADLPPVLDFARTGGPPSGVPRNSSPWPAPCGTAGRTGQSPTASARPPGRRPVAYTKCSTRGRSSTSTSRRLCRAAPRVTP